MAKKQSRGLVVAEETKQEVASVESMIAQGIDKGVPVETMERLLAMRKDLKKEHAQSAFIRAMSNFQSAVPIIEKTKKVMNKDGKTVRYMFAPIDSIVKQIQKPLMDNGLSYTWTVVNDAEFVIAKATITHILGHSESSEFKIPIDKEGFMTAPQKYASALTFAKRYALCNALGISTGEEDTDATDVGKESGVKSEKAQIMILLRTLEHKTETKEQVARAVKDTTGLDLEEENFGEIIGRLQIKVDENHQDESKEV